MSVIPMPPQIARLRRTAKGLPVPYVALWSGEMPYAVRPSAEFGGALALVESGRLHAGSPLLGQMNVLRQREVILRGRCQVCRALLARGPRWLVSLFEGTVGDALQAPVVREPWACPSCLGYALRVCPGLVGPARHADLFVLRVRRVGPPLATNTSLPGLARDGQLVPGTDTTPGTAIGYLKIVPTAFDVLDVPEFLALATKGSPR